MKQGPEGPDGISRDESPCVACVAESLGQLAETTSAREFERAERRLELPGEEDRGRILAMTRQLARRLVDPAVRWLKGAPPEERPRIIADIRETFGLEEPEECPLGGREEAGPPDPAALCPRHLRAQAGAEGPETPAE